MARCFVAIILFLGFTTHNHICIAKRIATELRETMAIVRSNETVDVEKSEDALQARLSGLAKGKRKLVYGGCFCPPHKGHFAQLQHLNEEYDEIFLFLYGEAESRHGYKPEINAQIWNLFKQHLPDGGAKVKLLPDGKSIVQGEPYIAGTQVLARDGHIGAGDSLTIAVGDDYTDYHVSRITKYLNNITMPLGVLASVTVMNRSRGGKTSTTAFCKALDATAYTYDAGTPVMYTSLSGSGKHPAVVMEPGNSSYTVKLDVSGAETNAHSQQISPGLTEGDCVIYTSRRGYGKFDGVVQNKDIETYAVILSGGAVKTATPEMIEPCTKVIDPQNFLISDFQDKFLPEGLNEHELAQMRQLLLTKSIFG